MQEATMIWMILLIVGGVTALFAICAVVCGARAMREYEQACEIRGYPRIR